MKALLVDPSTTNGPYYVNADQITVFRVQEISTGKFQLIVSGPGMDQGLRLAEEFRSYHEAEKWMKTL